MLKDDFYYITTEQKQLDSADYTIRLNPEHPIFKGHFPDAPIMPGVCIVEICAELFSHLHQVPFVMRKAKNIKFINIIKPTEVQEVDYKLSWTPNEDGYIVKAVVSTADTIFTKMTVELTQTERN